MVAALGNLEIGIVFRGQKNAACRHQVTERLMRSRKVVMHQTEDLFGLLRTCHAEQFRETQGDEVAFLGILPPKQPVTMTLPFSLNASEIASRDS